MSWSVRARSRQEDRFSLHRDLLRGQWSRGRARDHRGVGDAVLAAVAGAVDGAVGDLVHRAALMGADRREGLELALLRLGDHDLLLLEDLAAADRDVALLGEFLAGRGLGGGDRGGGRGGGGRRRTVAVAVLAAPREQEGRARSENRAPRRGVRHVVTPNVRKNQRADVSQMAVRTTKTSPPTRGSSQPGSR